MAIFYVEGNDAQTIAAAASIENAAEQRARAEADKTGGKPTMTFFASAQEAAVVIAANDLRAQYKEEFGLAKRPETGYNIEYTLFQEGSSRWN